MALDSAEVNRRVLMLTYHFPPMGGAGVQRSSKFVKYLPACGWQPTVVSGDDSAQVKDPTLLRDIPAGVRVERVPVVPLRRQKLYDTLFAAGLGRLVTLSRHCFDLPDRYTRWHRDAALLIEQLIEEEEPRVLFSSSAPFAAHLALAPLASKRGIPWVADFRDPWSENADLLEGSPNWVRKRHEKLERFVAESATHLVFAQPTVADSFVTRHGVSPSRVTTIPNGFDPDDIGNPGNWKPPSPREELLMSHVGSFYRRYNEGELVDAVRAVATESAEALQDVKFVFVGGSTRDLSQLAPAKGISLPRQTHAEALRWMRNSHALLLLLPESMGRHPIPAKMFEYLALRRPIFAVVPPGTTADWVRRSGCGVVVSGHNPKVAGEALLEFVRDVRAGSPEWFRPDDDFIQQFSRRRQAQNLAGVFGMVTGDPSARAGVAR